MGCFMIYKLNPFLITVINKMPKSLLNIISIILLMIYITDLIISSNVIIKLKDVSKVLRKDYTEEISAKVKQIIQSKLILPKRLLRAFPDIRNYIKFDKLIVIDKKKPKK